MARWVSVAEGLPKTVIRLSLETLIVFPKFSGNRFPRYSGMGMQQVSKHSKRIARGVSYVKALLSLNQSSLSLIE